MTGTTPPEERIESTGGLILPGGKVDREAVARLGELLTRDGDGEPDLPRVTFSLRRDLKSRLDRYLASRITFMSRTQLQRLIAGESQGGVLVNGKVCKPSTMLHAGDEIEVILPPPPPSGLTPEDIPLDVLFEDEHLIVLNKRPGIIVHPARSELSGTMVNALAFHFRHRSDGSLSSVGTEDARPGVVHRLDRGTTGCIVFAKSDEAHWKLAHQFERRRVEKRYLALVQGRVEPDADLVELPIGPHPSREKGYREKYVVRHDDLGRHAITLFRVRERFRDHARPVGDQDFTLLELELRTGRTHQIRVHLSHLGWPIVGDDMYAGRAFDYDPGASLARQALHAGLLGFAHPITAEPMEFTAPVPLDFRMVLEHLARTAQRTPVDTQGTRIDLDRALGRPAWPVTGP